MKRGGIFITGTDTDVGKTVVTALLAGLLQQEGYDVGLAKPYLTGYRKNSPSDLDFYKTLAAISDPVRLMAPARFRQPQAPAVAASLEKRSVRFEKALGSLYILRGLHRNLLIEGIGGVMVPLDRNHTVLDLIRKSGLPAVVVARPELGTINHTALTVSALKTARLPVAGIIFSGCPARPSASFRLVAEEIRRITRCPVLGTLPRFDWNAPVRRNFIKARNALDLDKIVRYFKK